MHRNCILSNKENPYYNPIRVNIRLVPRLVVVWSKKLDMGGPQKEAFTLPLLFSSRYCSPIFKLYDMALSSYLTKVKGQF